jgi:hypothetical protein
MKKRDDWASSWKGSLFGAFLCIAILYFLKTNYQGFLEGKGHSNKDGFRQIIKLINEFAGGEIAVYIFVVLVFLYFFIDAIRKYRKKEKG